MLLLLPLLTSCFAAVVDAVVASAAVVNGVAVVAAAFAAVVDAVVARSNATPLLNIPRCVYASKCLSTTSTIVNQLVPAL